MTIMKALVFATTNLASGAVLHVDPNHPTDNRARYPDVSDPVDVARLEREGIAETFEGDVPELDIEAALKEEDERAQKARDAVAAGKPLPPDPRVQTSVFQATRAQLARDQEAGRGAGRLPGANMSGQNAVRASRGIGPTEETDEEAIAAADVIEGGTEADAAPGSRSGARAGRGGSGRSRATSE